MVELVDTSELRSDAMRVRVRVPLGVQTICFILLLIRLGINCGLF